MADQTIKYIVTTISHPSQENPNGVVAEGWFIEANGTVTLVTRAGKAILNRQNKKYSQKLTGRDDPRRIAQRLVKDRYYATNNRSDFTRTLQYKNQGIV
jgi:hypothetical protein